MKAQMITRTSFSVYTAFQIRREVCVEVIDVWLREMVGKASKPVAADAAQYLERGAQTVTHHEMWGLLLKEAMISGIQE